MFKGLFFTITIISLQMIFTQSLFGQIHFKHIIIDSNTTSPQKPYGKAFGDLSGDSFTDILISSAKGDGIHWYEYPSWIKHTIRNSGSWSEDVQTGDVDGDGFIDVINGNTTALFWYKNPLSQSGNPRTDFWEATRIGSDGKDIHDLEVGDINGNNKLDVVIRYEKEYNLSVRIFIQQTPSSFVEIINVNSTNLGAEGLCLADINQDNNLDIVIGNVWCENNGDGTKWTEHNYTNGLPDQTMIRVADLDGNGSNDIIVSPQSGKAGAFAWFSAETPKGVWIEHTIRNNITRMHGLAIADFNLDGSLDIHTSLRHDLKGKDDNVSVWVNDGKAIPTFLEQVLSKSGSHFSKVADIGNDGDIDIIGANWSSNAPNGAPIEVWENLTLDDLRKAETE